MKVRCPACKTVHSEPSERFRCTGCQRLLAWAPPRLWLPEQLTLFPGQQGEPLALPLLAADAHDAPTPAVQPSALPEAIALVTAFLGDDPVLPSLVLDRPAEELARLALATAALASLLVRQVDQVEEGAGTAWLQAIALAQAGEA